MSFSFGGTATAPAASTGFSFGAPTAPSAAAPTGTGFSFGANPSTAAPAPGTPAPGGFSFGAAPAAAAPAPGTPAPGGFSFGATNNAAASTGFGFGTTNSTATSTAPTGGFSFGGASTAAAPANPASSTGFSFGTPAAAPATTTTPGFGFGATNTTGFGATNTAAKPGFGFGTGTTGATTTPGFGFGATTTTGSTGLFGAKPATTGFFGTTTPAPTGTGMFGATTTPGFGQIGQQTALAQPQQHPITLETLFDALPAEVKKNMTEFHGFLREEDQSEAFLKTVSARKLDDLKANLEKLEQDVLARRNLQDMQATRVHHVRKDVKGLISQVDTATLTLRSLDPDNTSQRFYGIMRRVDMPSGFYWDLLDQFEARMLEVKAQIEAVESEFQPLYERRAGNGSVSETNPLLMQQILLSHNKQLVQLAATVADVHNATEQLRQRFINKMKDDLIKHGDTTLATFKDPFARNKKNASRDNDIDTIRFKTSVVPTIVPSQQAAPQQPAPAQTGFGFGGFGSTSPSTTASTGGLFGSLGSSTAASTATTTTTPGFGLGTTAAAPSTGGFSFGGSAATTATTAPKTVSFNLSTGSTTATATSTTTTAPSAFSFTPALAATTAATPGSATPSVGTPATGFGSFFPSPTSTAAPGEKRSKSGTTRSSRLKTKR